MARIELDQVSKRFGTTLAVDNASVSIADNEFFCFFGPPSSGKTTILRLILGLETPDSGEIRIDGKRVNEATPAERNLAMVFQNLALFPHMSARDNVVFPLVERRMPAEAIEERLASIADTLHMAHILDKRPALLSGGERQRVAIGRALVRDAAAYLMDDPISALDARLREETRVELKRLQRDIGHTLIYVTHDQEEAMSVADRMAVLENGAIRQIDEPQALYSRPASRYVAALVGSPQMNFLDGHIDVRTRSFLSDVGSLSIPLAVTNTPSTSKATVGFRPEHVGIVAVGTKATIAAKVVSVEPLGSMTVVVTDVAGTIVKASLGGQRTFQVGDQVGLAVERSRCVLFGEDGQSQFPFGDESGGQAADGPA